MTEGRPRAAFFFSVIPRSEATWESVIFSCKFAEKRKIVRLGERIATPVCGLVRNDTAVRCWADRVVRPYGRSKGCGGKRRGDVGIAP